MHRYLIVVENRKDWAPEFPDVPLITAREYLARPELLAGDGIRVINLCRSYRYLSTGYFCSLLAEPRNHKVLPTVRTLSQLNSRALYSFNIEDLDELVQKSLRASGARPTSGIELPVFFGRCEEPALAELARQLFALFPCPLLKLKLRFHGKWQIHRVKPVPLKGWASKHHAQFFAASLTAYLRRPWRALKNKHPTRYDLAILHDPAESLPPSNAKALKKFIRVGRRLGLAADLIERKDYTRLAEYDALFIRETTGIGHHTYRFARKAQVEGLVVIDDPDSILKCTNKVYLAELLQQHGIPAPRTQILQKGRDRTLRHTLGYPVVLKVPDGSFSRGVFKADDEEAFRKRARQLFKESELILAQEFIYTEFDWRIGVLNHRALFACQYFMSRAHWQVIKHHASGPADEGGFKNWAVEDVPRAVVDTALRLAALIGDGLYGVDLKQHANGIFVIEINDNPNIDAGIEDCVLGDALYEQILGEFIRRLDERRTPPSQA